MHRGFAEARSEHLGRTTPDPHSAGGNSMIRNQNDNEGHDPGAQQLSEAAPERTSGDDQDGGGADGHVQSGGSKGESSCFNYTATLTNHY